jgi:Raf kinase inhibitor-like YbhB/YbcL family protein
MRGYTLLSMTLVAFLFGGEAMAFRIESPAFQSKEKIPQKYTCDGVDVSPPLVWADPPEGTKSFALISDDPDAPVGPWVHWVIYNLPTEERELQEGIPKLDSLPNGAKQGNTDFRRVGYGGPCPPPGKAHRYFFKLYALNTSLDLPPKATKADLLIAMNGHVLAQAELVGLYQRSSGHN